MVADRVERGRNPVERRNAVRPIRVERSVRNRGEAF